MANVTGLAISKQNASELYYASWKFPSTSGGSASSGSSGSSKTVRVGDLVTIKAGSKYYNGVSIPSWVMSDRWYVIQVSGTRAVLGKNASGSHNINSPIHINNLVGGTGTSSGGSSGGTSISIANVDHYEVKWWYDSGNGEWFNGSSSTSDRTNATYSPPANALKIKVGVKPVSKTYKSNGKDTTYFTGTWAYAEYRISAAHAPDAAPTPSVKIENFTLTATVDNISDARTDKIQFEVYNGSTLVKSAEVSVAACRAVFSCSIAAGGNYRVRCRAVYIDGQTKVYSDWSSFTGEESTVPTGVGGVSCSADSETSVRVTWSAVANATRYEVQYAVKKAYFDASSEVRSTTVDSTTAYITGLDASEWFFRVRAINNQGESAWSNIVSVIIGSTPEPPTTWSLTTTAVVGEDIILYWVHNAEDGSKQTSAQIQLTINGVASTVTVPGPSEDEEDPICSYTIDSSKYSDGATILWKVRTKGIAADYSDWSTQRTINLYAPPTLALSLSTVDGILSSLPLVVNATAGPTTQNPISFHVAIQAGNTYESEDDIGNTTVVSAGSEIYSKVFNATDWDFSTEISAGDVAVENGQSYTVTVIVSMDSGLTAEESAEFSINWTEPEHTPDASIAIDFDTLTAYISPFCIGSTGALADDVTVSVYRREYNGAFTPIVTDLPNDGSTTVTDPHPALDYARYRVVARHTLTGAVTYEDLPGQPIGEPSIVIQWDEAWSNFDYKDEGESAEPPWTGSMVRLPYNVDVSESYDPDVSLIEYIGRSHPVGYYGTQRGESMSCSTDVDKSDKNLVYALRRLAAWNGNVYVREPSGIGYWAHVTVSMSTKHNDPVTPVSFEIKRVEGDK